MTESKDFSFYCPAMSLPLPQNPLSEFNPSASPTSVKQLSVLLELLFQNLYFQTFYNTAFKLLPMCHPLNSSLVSIFNCKIFVTLFKCLEILGYYGHNYSYLHIAKLGGQSYYLF